MKNSPSRVPPLYKLAFNRRMCKTAAINIRSLMYALNVAAKRGKHLQTQNLLSNIKNFNAITNLSQLKKAMTNADNYFDMSDLLRKITGNKGMHPSQIADSVGFNSLKITALNKQLGDFGLSGLFNKDGLVAVINKKTGDILPSQTFTGSFGNFSHKDLHPLTHSLLSSRFGQIKILPRSTISHDSPSVYFGFAKDPQFNLPYYNKIRLQPKTPLDQLYSNIGRVYNTRHHNMFGGQYKRLIDDVDSNAPRYYGQHIIAQNPDYSGNIEDLVSSINRLFRHSNKQPLNLPSYMYGNGKQGMANLTNFDDWY